MYEMPVLTLCTNKEPYEACDLGAHNVDSTYPLLHILGKLKSRRCSFCDVTAYMSVHYLSVFAVN